MGLFASKGTNEELGIFAKRTKIQKNKTIGVTMRIKKVEYIDGYKLRVFFSDKKVKVVDLEEKINHSKGIFLPLKKLDYFKKVFVDDCELSICWPNGADICPDVLYEMGVEVELKRNRLKNKNHSKLQKGNSKKSILRPRKTAARTKK